MQCAICLNKDVKYSSGWGLFICSQKCTDELVCLSCCRLTRRVDNICQQCDEFNRTYTGHELKKALCIALGYLKSKEMIFTKELLSKQCRKKNIQSKVMILKKFMHENNYTALPSYHACGTMINKQVTFWSHLFGTKAVNDNFVQYLEQLGETCDVDHIMKVLNIYYDDSLSSRFRKDNTRSFSCTLGVTSIVRNDPVNGTYIGSVKIFRGSPFMKTVGTLVHELMHCYLFLLRISNNLYDLDSSANYLSPLGQKEESFCILLSSLFWSNLIKSCNSKEKKVINCWLDSARKSIVNKQYIDYLQNAVYQKSIKRLAYDIAMDKDPFVISA